MQNQQLPPEAWLGILKHVSTEQLYTVGTTCKNFNNLTAADSYLWQVKFTKTFGSVKKPAHLSWRDFYINYAVTWCFGQNNFGQLGQGPTALAKMNYNQTCIEQVFVSATAFDRCTAFFDQHHRVWFSGLLPNGNITNTPMLYLTTPVKQIVSTKRNLLYVNMADQLCDQHGQVLVNEVQAASDKYCINYADNVCQYTYTNQQLQTQIISAPCKLKQVKEDCFQDQQGRLWHYSRGHWMQILLNDQHVPVLDFVVCNKRIAAIDQQGHFWLKQGGRFELISSHHFVQVATGINHTLALDTAGQVWAIGKNNNYGQLGPVKSTQLEPIEGIQASSIAAGSNSSIIIGQTF